MEHLRRPAAGGPSVLRLLGALVPLELLGGALGLRVARLGAGPLGLTVVVLGVLATIALVLLLVAVSSRRRRRVELAAHPEAAAVTAGLLVTSSPRGRRAALPVGVVLLADRVLVDPRRRSRSLDHDVTVPFSGIAHAEWSTTVVGARVSLLLTITPTFGSGGPVVLRLDPRRQDVVVFATALQEAFERWLPGRAPQPPDLTGSASRRIAGLVLAVGVCGIVLAVTGGYAAGVELAHHRGSSAYLDSGHEIAGAPGYYTYSGPEHEPIAVGAPWGAPCKPVVVQVDPGVPANAYAALVAVAQEARAAGVDIAVADRSSRYRLTDLYNTGGTPAGVQVVTVRTAVPEQHLSTHENLGWNAVPAPDGAHEHVTVLVEDLNLQQLHTTADLRRAAEALIGYSQGVAVSSRPRSAFAAEFARQAVHFSAEDERAMLVMSGCRQLAPGS